MTPTIALLCVALAGQVYQEESYGPPQFPVGVNELESVIGSLHSSPVAASRTVRAPARSTTRVAVSAIARPKVAARPSQAGLDQRPLARRTGSSAKGSVPPTGQTTPNRRREQPSQPELSGSVANNADELLNLIQTSVAPDTWEINGGRGSIFYFSGR